MTSFPKTAAALVVYDKGAQEREALFEYATTDGEVYYAALVERKAQDRVRVEFHSDTKDLNSIDHCMVASMHWLRQLTGGGA